MEDKIKFGDDMTEKELIELHQKNHIALINTNEAGIETAQSQAGAEAESSKDYIGRVVFEFFQNALDRADPNIWLELTKDCFIISNNGQPFSIFDGKNESGKKSDFHSLNTIYNGVKIPGESVGNKGVGFKSCWNVCSNVSIESINEKKESWGFELFNPITEQHFIDNDLIQKVLIKTGYNIPSFYFPKYYESSKKDFKGDAVTKITIKFDKENKIKAYTEIKKELEEFQKSKFIFLNQLKKKEGINYNIYIIIDDKEQHLKSKDKAWDVVSLTDKDTYINMHQELIKARIDEKYKNIPEEPNIAISFPPDNIDENMFEFNFYTYLPTKAKCGFNVLIHADFALDNARVSIPDNQYNNKILDIASKLFVSELLNNTNLHKRKDFAKFLIPKHRDEKFAKLVWSKLVHENTLTKILKKVFTEDRYFPQESYELLFNVINIWTPQHVPYAPWGDEYWDKIVYQKCLKYFCDDKIFIVYIDEKYKSSLPKKNEIKKLFYIDKSNAENKYNFNLLKKLSNITLASMTELNSDIFIKNNIVKENRNIEIYRTLAVEMKNNQSLSEDIKLDILKFLSVNVNESFNFDYFELDSKKRNSKAGYQLAKILLPTINNGWQAAKKCFINIEENVSKSFTGFYEIDYEKIKDIFTSQPNLKFFGVWETIPINEDFTLAWNDNNFPKVEDDSFKYLLQKSILIWKEIAGISKPEIKNIFTSIQKQKIFYDTINKNFCSPNEVFLFNDERKRNIISQALKDDKFNDLYEHLEIFSIDQTRDKDKLFRQLKKLKNNHSIINTTHKTLYKQLILSFSKDTEEYKNFESIPLLSDNMYITVSNNIWFADRNSKRYMHYFNSLKFISFDIETKKDFVRHAGVKLFEPDFSLKPDSAKKEIQKELKIMIEDTFLTHMFCLAEEIMHINRFSKEESISRWNSLKIGYAEDVWLEIKLAGIVKPEELGKGKLNHDVLFKPLSDSQRQSDKEKVGEIIHDLNIDLEQPMENPKFAKFGYVIADGVFRDVALGSVLSDFLRTRDKDSFLKERGIGELEVREMQSFIKQSILTASEINIIINIINSEVKEDLVNSLNWYLLDTYLECTKSFKDLERQFCNETEKIKNVVRQLSPKNYNLSKISSLENELKLKYFITHSKEISDKEFDKKVENIGGSLLLFNLEKRLIYQAFDIKDNISHDEMMIAEIELENDIKVDISTPSFSPSKAIESSQFKENKQTSVRKKSEKEQLKSSERQQKRGLAFERIFAIRQASQLIKDETRFMQFEKLYLSLKDLDHKVDFNNKTLQNLADIIQVSKSTGDGLGYDVLELVGEETLQINKVEIKSSRGNNSIHFSNNEVEEIYKMTNDNAWKLYHYVDDKVYDRTDLIKVEVKKLKEHQRDNKSTIIADSWIISFEKED